MEKLKDLALTEGYEDWIFVAWAFREHKVFYELSRVLILEWDEWTPLHPGLPYIAECKSPTHCVRAG